MRRGGAGLLAAIVVLMPGIREDLPGPAKAETSHVRTPSRRPNVLLLFTDQHNAGALGCAGHPDVQTPHLDRLAAESVRFTRAYCQDGICVPSRSSLMTGQYCRTVGVVDNRSQPAKPEDLLPLARVFRTAGYRTAAFGKRHLPPQIDHGWDEACSHLDNERSDETYRQWVGRRGELEAFERDWNAEFGYRLPGNQAAPMACLISRLSPGSTMEAFTAAKTIAFLKNMRDLEEPFFCWASFYRPHQPYTPLEAFADLYDPSSLRLPDTLGEPAESLPPLLRKVRQNKSNPWCLARAARDVSLYRRYISYYYALVTEIDHHVGSILTALDELGMADDTIVIYTTDHGDFVGAHGMIEKCAGGHNVYEDTLRVPLIIRWPGRVRRDTVADDLVELVDLYPTLLELTGVQRPKGYDLAGRSLAGLLTKGGSLGREAAFSENGVQLAAITQRYKLGVWLERQGDYPDMLFDRESDPLEAQNLIGRPEVAHIEKRLRDAIQEWIARTPVPSETP